MRSAAAALVFVACGAGAPEPDDTSAVDSCETVDVTWSNWGFAFFSNYCRSCHSVDAPDRYGAPESVNFDSLADVVTWAERIRVTTLDEEAMPVGGGVPDIELERLDQLLECGL